MNVTAKHLNNSGKTFCHYRFLSADSGKVAKRWQDIIASFNPLQGNDLRKRWQIVASASLSVANSGNPTPPIVWGGCHYYCHGCQHGWKFVMRTKAEKIKMQKSGKKGLTLYASLRMLLIRQRG